MGADRTHCVRLAANFAHSLVRELFESCFPLRILVWSRPSSLTTNAWDVVLQGRDCYPQTHLPLSAPRVWRGSWLEGSHQLLNLIQDEEDRVSLSLDCLVWESW